MLKDLFIKEKRFFFSASRYTCYNNYRLCLFRSGAAEQESTIGGEQLQESSDRVFSLWAHRGTQRLPGTFHVVSTERLGFLLRRRLPTRRYLNRRRLHRWRCSLDTLIYIRQWRSRTSGVRGVRTPVRKIHNFWSMWFLSVIGLRVKHRRMCRYFLVIQAVWYVMTFFDCTADLVGQLNGNGQNGMLQIDAPTVEIVWLRHWHRLKWRHRIYGHSTIAMLWV